MLFRVGPRDAAGFVEFLVFFSLLIDWSVLIYVLSGLGILAFVVFFGILLEVTTEANLLFEITTVSQVAARCR